ncbi:exported hypothetical protein [uncultured spirochete]|jgi:hypothetical protein|uniref:Lipoprotein n=1 Tax=uncultured spirochete TaxID=156406 RepID=A0A3P3XSG4_9SPIR|nr:exported hypothetical protein [uncultured spirochete]
MRRGYVAYAALLAMVILLFTGCDALIGNAFKAANLGQPSVEKIKELDTAALVAQAGITSGSVSDTFIQTIISDDATKAAVLATLQTTVDTGSASDAQAAQALILDIKLADIGADEVISNVNGAIGELASLSDSEDVKPADIINTLLPADLTGEALADFIDEIGALGTDVDTLAQKITDNGGTVTEGLDVATLAQTAALVKFVNIVDPADGYSTGEAVAQAVADLKADPDADVTKYFDKEPDISSLADDATLKTLFDAAGLGDLLDQLSGSGS